MKCKLVSGTKENLKATVEKLGIRGKMDLKPVIETVQQVIDNIRDNGDKALLGYTEKFDGVKLEASEIRVTDEEIAAAKASIDPELEKQIGKIGTILSWIASLSLPFLLMA